MKSVSPGSPLIQSLHRNQDTHKNIKEIYVSVQGVTLDYAAVHALAGKATGDAMMVAWYDGKTRWVIGRAGVHRQQARLASLR